MTDKGLFDDSGRINPEARNNYTKPHLNFRPAGQPTSKVAAVKYEETGKGKTQRELVHDYIIAHPGVTGGEMETRIRAFNGASDRSARKRLCELRRDGFIIEGVVRECEVTGENVLTWWSIKKGN